MVLFVLIVLIIVDDVFHCALDLSAALKDALYLLLTVMQSLKMEAVVVAGVHRIHDGEQTTDGIVDRGQELAVLGGVDAAFELFAAAHVEVGFHAAAQKRLIK